MKIVNIVTFSASKTHQIRIQIYEKNPIPSGQKKKSPDPCHCKRTCAHRHAEDHLRSRSFLVMMERNSHGIHAWYIYLYDFYGKCRYINTWIFQICKNVCLLVGFSGEFRHEFYTQIWKIQGCLGHGSSGIGLKGQPGKPLPS